MNGKLISRLNVFAIIIAMCLAIIICGFTDFNQVHADVQPQDVEVTNLNTTINYHQLGDISFNLEIKRKVKQGEEVVLAIGYDKVDNNDKLIFARGASGAVKVNGADGSQAKVGVYEVSNNSIKFTFNKKAEEYDTLKLNVNIPKIMYDQDFFSNTNSEQDLKIPFYLKMDEKNITKNEGVFNRKCAPYVLDTSGTGFFKLANGQYEVMTYLGKADLTSFRSGDIIINIPTELKVDKVRLLKGFFMDIKKPDKNKTTLKLRFVDGTEENSISVSKIEENKVVLHFNKDNYKSGSIEGAGITIGYKDGFSYKDDPARVVKVDLTGIGGKLNEVKIKEQESNYDLSGEGDILDASKYQPEASPIIVHKGDELSNKMITDHVIIKDKDGKTVKAEDINATKTRVDNNKIDTNTVGNYSATVNVEYKDGSTENVTVPIKVIDNVIPNLPDENGKNPEKPDGYVTVTMNAGQNGMLAKGEAKEYFVNPEKVVTIPAKDAIGKLGYKFSKWDSPLKAQFKKDKTINAKYEQLPDVIPNVPDHNGKKPEKPDGYVTVTMNAGQNGMLAKGEAKEYFVNPEKVVTIPAKDAIGKLGYKFSKWDSPLKAQFKKDKTINAKYKQLPDVIPNVPDNNGKNPEKPDGYVTVVVDPGNNGKLDPRDAGEYFVNPTKKVTIPIHNAVPNDGYKFNKWSPSKTGHFDHDMTIKAKYLANGNANKPQTGDNGIEIPLAILISTIGMAFVAVKTKKHI